MGIILSVIIVSYNCFDYTEKCLASIFKYNDIGDELQVIVVDNGSDETYKRLQNHSNLIKTKVENKGFGAGNNAGETRAKGAFLLFLNPDTELTEPIFKFAIDKFKENENLGAFGVQLLNKNNKNGPSIGLRMRFGLKNQLYDKVLQNTNHFINQIMFTSGADLFVRKNVFDQCGKFDENIFMYCEEADLYNRINKIGYTTTYFKQRHIIHYEGKTDDVNLSKQYKRELKSRIYYCAKYNIDYAKYAKSEIRYRRIESLIFKILGKHEKYREYEIIIDTLNESLNAK